jgi:methylthioribose-1-phosphate isomerase
MLAALAKATTPEARVACAQQAAQAITDEDVAICKAIGRHGLPLIEAVAQSKPGQAVQIMTHCNAGRLATVEYGTATAPIYLAHEAGIPLHVWVSETRPRNQGAFITAWELAEAGIPHTVIVDNAAGHLMQHGQVDLCLVGTDRTTRQGDVANKIGTYLKALAAHANGVPFYVCLPSTTIDWTLDDGVSEIPIETRSPEEVTHLSGWDVLHQQRRQIRLTPADSPALNYGFDVTPARYLSGLITERGICDATAAGLRGLFPEMATARP